MARHRTNQAFELEDRFDQLTHAPIWAGPILAVLVYAMSRWATPWLLTALLTGSSFGEPMSKTLSLFALRVAPLLAGGILLLWIAAEFKKWINRRRFEQQSGSWSVGTLGWREFESLLAEAFRRQGFVVEHTGQDGADGGIDIRLSKAGAITPVQCKHWKRQQVGVQVVRELLGVVTSKGAQSGIVVTSGQFTAEATDFTAKNPIRLMDGRELVLMISEVQQSGGIERQREEEAATSARAAGSEASTCPKWGAALVQRTAKQGSRSGSQFFGCLQYPGCRYTRDIKA